LAVRTLAARDHRDAWERAVPGLAARSAALAARHPLDPARTAELAADSAALEAVDLAAVSRLVRARATAALPTGAWLAHPDVPWAEVVLPPESGLQLRDAVARLDHEHAVLEDWGLRRRAHAVRGARLLLTGPPGTGKSLAAGAVATALETDLLVVDVSRIVSKWLGETEKNLSAVFDAAERTQAVLLLDEADALFATRTEVADAHDRYANLETAYLLQRLDRFEGLAILTSNLRGNIDVAFVRRMDFVVEFPLPDLDLRRDLWRLHLPEQHLADDVDVDAMSRLYAVPGAWIRNCVVGAAYTAAAADGPVHLHHLVAAMRREFAKAGLPFPGEPLRRHP
jgi:SpoVK/Ycf46/Vps4 family AAA+-type ATPase